MITRIVDRRFTLKVRVLQPEAEVVRDGTPEVGPVEQFIREFWEIGDQVKAPRRRWIAEDFGIAKNLLQRWSKEQLLEFALIFWLSYSEPVFTDHRLPALRLFSHRLPEIKREA